MATKKTTKSYYQRNKDKISLLAIKLADGDDQDVRNYMFNSFNWNKAKVAKLDDTIARYEAVQEEIGRISNSEYIIDYAQNELGMVKGN